MLEPKRIAKEAVAPALEKALRYRLLNEPLEAESICRDVLEVDADNQQALVTLLLALTDQFDKQFGTGPESARDVLTRIRGDYEREYYAGIVNERWGKAQLVRGLPGDVAIGWFREAMRCYEKAEAMAPADDPDATLRWNTCARFIERYQAARPVAESVTYDVQAGFGDDVPPR